MNKPKDLTILYKRYCNKGQFYEAQRIIRLLSGDSIYLGLSDVDETVYNDISDLPVIWSGNVSKYGGQHFGIRHNWQEIEHQTDMADEHDYIALCLGCN